MIVSRSYAFEAAHFLPMVADGHKCRRLHGHSYVVTVGVRGDVGDDGMVVDFAKIDAVCKPVSQGLDHRLLNDITGLENPTSENLCLWFAEEIKAHLTGLAFVEVSESRRSSCRLEVGA